MMMMQQPPPVGGCGGGGVPVHPLMDQQQQPQYSASPQPTTTTTTSSTAQEEEEEEDHTVWIGNLQQWRHKVEKKEVRTLWIGDLQPWMDESYIDRCFVHTGEDFCSKVIRNKKKTSECYGFIEFHSHDIAERFLHKFDGTPMPEVSGTTNFNLNWASSFGSEEEEEEDPIWVWGVIGDDDFANDKTMLSQETFPTVNHLCCATQTQSQSQSSSATQTQSQSQSSSKEGIFFLRCGVNAQNVNSSWENMLKWQCIAKGTRTPQAVLAVYKVYAIGAFLKKPYCFKEQRGLNATEVEGMLDELIECFDDTLDVVKELHSFGAFECLFHRLVDKSASIRAKAAKLIRTMVERYPCSRLIIMNGNRGEKGEYGKNIYYLYWEYDDPTFEADLLAAISLLYENGDEPSISAFREHCCELLRINLASWNVGTHHSDHRKALNLMVRLVSIDDSSKKMIGVVLKYLFNIIWLANSSYDAAVRKAALGFLHLLATDKEDGNIAQAVKNHDKLKRVLHKRTNEIYHEDQDTRREEIQLLDSLWSVCYDVPSSLREKYPSFWKRAAFEAADTNSVGEKKKLHKVQ